MSKTLPPDILAAHGADQDNLLVAAGARLWEPEAVGRYKRSQIWSHPTAVMSYYLGLGARYETVRLLLALPVATLVGVATFLLVQEAVGIIPQQGDRTIVAALAALVMGMICFVPLHSMVNPLWAWRWETHEISLKGEDVEYHTESALQSRFDRTSGIPDFAKDLMRRVHALFPGATFTLQVFGPDPILTAHLPNGISRTILVWDGDEIIEPR